jgi:ectoine hydroxylase
MHDIYPSRCAAEPEMRPRQDPVVHGEWQPGGPLSREQTEQFERHGYLVLEGLFDAAEVDALQSETARLLADPSSLDAETMITEPGSKEVRSIFAIHEQSRLMARLAADERLAGVASFLLGDEVYLHQTRLNYKPGFKGKEFYWHSDFETWHVEDGMPRMRAVSASLLLSANDEHNGPLLLIPASHRTFVTCVGETPDDHYKASLRRQDYGVPDHEALADLVAAGGLTSVTGPPGTVVFFDCNTMHGSNGNITPQPRSNVFVVYNGWSNRLVAPFGGTRPRPEFIATRDVSEPLAVATGALAR